MIVQNRGLSPRAVELVNQRRKAPRVQLRNEAGRYELMIYAPIGVWWEGGLDAQTVVRELEQAKGGSLDVRIFCEGGDVFQAKAIYNAIRRFEGPKTCYVDGLAASAAVLVMLAGDRIVAAPGSSFMTHPVSAFVYGGSADLRRVADQVDTETATIADIYARRTGKTPEEMLAWIGEERWFDCATAIQMGFVDAEEEPGPDPATTLLPEPEEPEDAPEMEPGPGMDDMTPRKRCQAPRREAYRQRLANRGITP